MCFKRWVDMICRIDGLVVSVPASGLFGPSSNLASYSNFRSRYVNHKKVRGLLSARRKGGIGAVVGDSRTIC